MHITKLIVTLLGALLIPQSSAASFSFRNLKSKNTEKKFRTNQAFEKHIADIFDIPIPEISETIKKCKNIVCIHFTLCVDDIVVNDGTDLFELRLSMRSDIDPEINKIECDDFQMPCCADHALTAMEREHGDEIPNNSQIPEDYNLDYDLSESVPKCGSMITKDNLRETEHPWLVSLYLRNPMDQMQYIGGGSLIHTSAILTAAHVIMGIPPELLVIRAGDHSSDTLQERNVTNLIIHEELLVRTLINDIALIVTERPFEFSDYVNPICLPPQSIQTNGGIMCTANGWKNGFESAALEKFELPIVDRNQCEMRLRQTRLGPYFRLSPSLMCAGGLGFETCKGDRGSPLICEIPHLKDRFYQTGIMAGGLGCDESTPGIYVNISHFTDWIQQQLRFIGHTLDPDNVIPFKYFV